MDAVKRIADSDASHEVGDRPSGSSNGSPNAPLAPAALALDGVTVTYRVKGEPREVLRTISLQIQAGECYGLVGESGCGKSTVALAALGYLPRGGAVQAGRLSIAGRALDAMDATALRLMRAHDVSMIYQDAARALNPSMTIGRQLTEAFVVAGTTRTAADAAAESMLQRVQIDQASRVMRLYPHELSGGMQQRVVIAMALAPRPSLLILDEPTTGLDATVEAEILSLLRSIRAEQAIAMLFISHDLGVIESMCDRVGVLYAGELVEEAEAHTLFSAPRHPYTAGLLACLPRGRSKRQGQASLMTIPGTLPDIGRRPAACIFADRCGLVQPRCLSDAPPLYRVDDGLEGATAAHTSRCHFFDKVLRPSDDTVISSQTDIPMPLSGIEKAPVLSVKAISKSFATRDGEFKALDDVSFDIGPGETLGLVGESGSGKTTLAKLLLGLEKPDTPGGLAIDGVMLADHVTHRSAQQIRALQVVFQNPDGALNRAWTVRKLIARSIVKLTPGPMRPMRWRALLPWRRVAGSPERARPPDAPAVSEQGALKRLIDAVRLPERFLDARAAELSGGLKQRVAIARAFAGSPRLIVCDEPTSALDVSVQAAILNLLSELQRQNDVSYLFISHDMDVVRYLADRIAVLYKGKIVEIGRAEDIFTGPHHPYTAQLLGAASLRGAQPAQVTPTTGSSTAVSDHSVMHTAAPVSLTPTPIPTSTSAETVTKQGCPFYQRCPVRIEGICDVEVPPERAPHAGHRVACHLQIATLPRSSQISQSS